MPTLEVTVIQNEVAKHTVTQCKSIRQANELVAYFAEHWVIVDDPVYRDDRGKQLKLALPGGD